MLPCGQQRLSDGSTPDLRVEGPQQLGDERSSEQEMWPGAHFGGGHGFASILPLLGAMSVVLKGYTTNIAMRSKGCMLTVKRIRVVFTFEQTRGCATHV